MTRRISKDPEERREELLDAASALFLSKGYDQTAVSDIVKRIGVSQGTFYYYFKSKEEILFAILEKEGEGMIADFQAIPENKHLDPLEKLQLAFMRLFQPGPSVVGKMNMLISDSGSSLYRLFHQRWDEIRLRKFKPVITKIIKEGVKTGIFHTAYPEELTEILFWGISRYIHNHHQNFNDPAYFLKKMKALQELMEKVLGLEQGRFQFVE